MANERRMSPGWLLAAGGVAAGLLLGRNRPERSLAGKVVLITGARGLALLMARSFATRGARIALCARDGAELERARRELEARGTEVFTQVCDVSDRQEVESLIAGVVSRFGGVDVLVNNAGVIQVGPFETMGEKEFADALAVNFWGTFHCSRAVLPSMRERGGGRIVNITSIGGEVAVPHLLPYSVGKFAAVGFSSGLAAELAGTGIRVTTVVPHLMRTGSFVRALFKGQRRKEMEWFSVGSTLPGISLDAERAAEKIVDACEKGRPWLTLGFPAKGARLLQAVAPGLTVSLAGLAGRLLPSGEASQRREAAEPGWKHRGPISRSFVTRLGDRAALRNNEQPGRA